MLEKLCLAAALVLMASPAVPRLEAQPGHKVLICHIPPGNPENRHEIEVDYHAVPAHVREHGDLIGPCSTPDPQ